jgi:transcriptional regulator with XRE-family HTH domain
MSDLPAMTFGQFIKEKREQLGYTLTEAADAVKVNQASIASWEKDQSRPFVSSIHKLANAYGLNIEELIKFDYKHKPHKNYPPALRVQKEILYAINVINKMMTGTSEFEAKMKANLLNVMDECNAKLETVRFLDAAF